MARPVGYIASSLDGFIAGPGETLDFLERQGLQFCCFSL